MRRSHAIACAIAVATLATGVLARLGHPLLWQDEGEVAMYATRILEFGYPKVHDGRNVVYEFGSNVAVGVKESVDAYIGRTWGDFYFAVPGVWWARGVDDPHARTWRLRLPFALAGLAGLGLMLWGGLPCVPAGRRMGFAAAFAALCASSVSLLLHLRELRYYPLLVAVLGAMLALHGRSVHGGRAQARAGPATPLLQAALSVALFQVFYVGWFATTALLCADAWLGLSGRERVRALLPHAVGVAAAIPALWFFETLDVARAFASDVGLSALGVLGNLAQVGGHFLRHEALLPALCARLAVLAGSRRSASTPPATHPGIAPRLWLFALGYTAVGCLNPLIYERYFVVLGPLLSLAFLLDASTLLDRAPALWPRLGAGRARRATALALLGLALLPLALRAPALRGRIAEIVTPVRGPVDFLVEHLRARHADPSALVIATNYEAHPLMYYLGSRVIVGLALNNIAAERALVPDVVIPRRAWRRPLPELRRFLSRGGYREERLPVLDTHYNSQPSLTASPAVPDPHRFATPAAAPGDPGALRVFHREPGTG